jgi:FlaA1/EpsC-like NDP-sugar epimerase
VEPVAAGEPGNSPMIIINYLKQQNWWLAIPCFFFLWAFNSSLHSSGLSLLFAFSFMVCYSIKYAYKNNNKLIDLIKLLFYFIYFTTLLLTFNYFKDYHNRMLLIMAMPSLLFFIYHINFILHIKNYYMNDSSKKRISNFLIGFLIVQSIMTIGVGIWAITQKVEADKQKVLAMEAKNAAYNAQKESERLRIEIESIKKELIETKKTDSK